MSERIIAHGSDFMCFLREGEEGTYTYRAIAGQTNVTLNREPNYRETNNKNLGGWKDFFGGLKGWSATVEMDIPDQSAANADANEVDFEELQDLEEAFTKATWIFCWVQNMSDTDENPVPDTTKRMYYGVGLVNLPLNTPPGENATTSIAIQGCRRLYAIDPT
jgi:hypothetical protein